MKQSEWHYKKAEVRTIYGASHPRVLLTDPNTKAIWKYVQEAWTERIDNTGPDTCWGWKGAYHRQGLGMFAVQRENDTSKSGMMNPQRLAMAIKLNRPLLKAERVYSKCLNPVCCNPDHLGMGSRSLAVVKERTKSKMLKRWSIEYIDQHLDLIVFGKRRDVAKELGVTVNQVQQLKLLATKRMYGQI